MRGPSELIRAFAPGGPPAGHFIEGRICDVGGRPVAARIAARCAATGRISETRADDEGAFVLAVGPGEHEVAATAPAGGDAFRRRVFPPARIDLVLTPPARITGQAVAGNGPGVAGVRLRLRKGDESTGRSAWVLDDFSPREATTAADGRFEMFLASSLDGVLALEVAGGPVRVGQRTPLPSAWGAVTVVVPVEPADPVPLRGQVRDLASNVPLARAEVRCDLARAWTDASGAFRLEAAPPGRTVVEVSLPGRPVYRERVDVERGSRLLLRVPAGVDLAGTALDQAGAPVSDARVCWTGAALRRRTRTDAAGRFRIEGIAPEHGGVLQAWAAGFVPEEAWTTPGEAQLAVRLRPGGRLAGRVSGPDGAPLAGMTVRLAPAARGPGGSRMFRDLRAVRTDDDGHYLFEDLPEGDVWILVAPRDPKLAPARLRAAVPPGALGHAADLRLQAGEALSGLVTDPDGAPVPGTIVRLVSSLRSAFAVADARGRFTLPPSAPWKEVVAAVAPGYAAASVVVQEGAPLPPVVLLPLTG